MKKNVFKLLGIICIIAIAAAFIVACGDGEEGTKNYTVTFKDGDTTITTQTVPADGLATKPSDPTKDDPLEDRTLAQGLYEDPIKAPSFDKWDYDFTKPITANTTINAVWKDDGSKPLTLVAANGNTIPDDIVSRALATIKAVPNKTATNKYILMVGDPAKSDEENLIKMKGVIAMSDPNTKLTIRSIKGAGRIEITPDFTNTGSNLVQFTIGPASFPSGAIDNSISLTLYNIALKGTGTAVGDSLVRVRNGGILILDGSSTIYNHKNSATTGGGANGNGAALCVVDCGQLIVKDATIEKNEATGTNNNQNLVGGVYANSTTNSATRAPIVKIEGGVFQGNEGKYTKDLYITEFTDFTMTVTGALTIGDFTINADNTGGTVYPTIIKIPAKVTNPINLNLRTTDSLQKAKDNWVGKVVLQGVSASAGTPGYTVTTDDVAKFQLKEWRGTFATTYDKDDSTPPQDKPGTGKSDGVSVNITETHHISGSKAGDATADIGKLVAGALTTTP